MLPLYIDNACGEQTAKVVETHLQSCENCKKLYEEMSSDSCLALHTPEFESDKIFRNALKNILGVIIALAVIISSFVINMGGAWMGDSAGIGNFIVTILYIVFWGVFSFLSRKYMPLINTSFVISMITFVSATAALTVRLLHVGGFVTAFLIMLAPVPFYGFRLFMDWTGLYATAAVISLCWLICAWYLKRKLRSGNISR